MKIRTTDELDDRIREDYTWRRHELQFFDQQLTSASAIASRSLLRASVALLYAHWEGFVKTACHYYLCYVASLKLPVDMLSPEMAALSLRSVIQQGADTASAKLHIEMVTEFREGATARAKIPTSRDAIHTKSNLSFAVLHNILTSVGIDPTKYEYAADLINLQLVDYRNRIAHGQNDHIERSEWRDLQAQVLAIMESIANELVNRAVLKQYLAASGT